MYEINNETNCWIWIGPTCSNGRYGYIKGMNPLMMAHRYFFQENKREIPKGMFVCHTCDNGLCVNPDHLFLGTPKDNIQDCLKKGRLKNLFKNQKGQNNANAKPNLIERNKNIIEDRRLGLTYSQLKEKYNLKSNGHLNWIIKNYS